MAKNKNKFTDKSNIRLGFEVECVIDMPLLPNTVNHTTYDDTHMAEYRRMNRTRLLKFRGEIFALNKKMKIGADRSINKRGFGWFAETAELKTPPLPPKSAMELLERVFEVVNKYGGTNASCGFHVNISSTKKSDMMKFNPIIFSSSAVWKQLLESFKRKRNTFCRPTFSFSRTTSQVSIIRQLANRMENKYHCVNFSNFGNGRARHSRVEIRGMGNAHYSKKYQKIADYIYRIQRLFKLSCNDFNLSKVVSV